MDVFGVEELRGEMPADAVDYREFLRVSTMSAGVYRLPAGSVDPQSPHAEDEVYVVIEGRATLTADGERQAVGPGSVAYVAAGAVHRFEDISEELLAVVLFAPPESSPE